MISQTLIFPLVIIGLLIILALFYVSSRNKTVYLKDRRFDFYKDISEEELSQYVKDKTMIQLKNALFKKFTETQAVYSDYSFENLKSICTLDLYNKIVTDVNELTKKNLKKMNYEYKFVDGKVTSIREDGNYYVISMYLEAEFVSSVLNLKTKERMDNFGREKQTHYYLIDFLREKDNGIREYCHKCKKIMKVIEDEYCPVCRERLEVYYKDFIVSSIKETSKDTGVKDEDI